MNELTRKKISWTAIRKHCKKLEGDIDELFVNFPADGVTKLKAFKLNYEAQVKRVHDVDEVIANLLTTDAELETELDGTLVLDDIFYGTLAKIDHRLEEISNTETKIVL